MLGNQTKQKKTPFLNAHIFKGILYFKATNNRDSKHKETNHVADASWVLPDGSI